jgi:hypothetical protein
MVIYEDSAELQCHLPGLETGMCFIFTLQQSAAPERTRTKACYEKINKPLHSVREIINDAKYLRAFKPQSIQLELKLYEYLKMAVFRDVAPCSPVGTERCFRGACGLHHQAN